MLSNCAAGEDPWESLGLQGNQTSQSWIITERTDADDETLILWPPDAKSRLIRKDPDLGKDQRQEKNGTIEGEMVGWHHQINGHEFGQTLGESEGQGSLVCCSSWGRSVRHDRGLNNEQQQRHESVLPWASDKNLLSIPLLKCKCPLQWC